MKIKFLRASVFCCVALSVTDVADADRVAQTDVIVAEDNAALSLRPNLRLSEKNKLAELKSRPLVHSDINCGEGNDLCGEGSACAGIRIAYLNLCEGSDFFMTDECSFLLSKLHSEAQNQNIEPSCVYYLRLMLPDNEEKRHDEVSTYLCPTEEGWTTDLKSGQTETVSCANLYPSGIFYGFLHRYCMLDGENLIHDGCSIIQNKTLPMVGLGMNKMKLPHSTQLIQLGNNETYIYEGAKKSQVILSSAADVLGAANDVGLVSKALGDIVGKLGPALGAIGVAFAIIDIFLPKQDSAELVYMKNEFKVVNSKLDAITVQLQSVEDKLKYALFKNKFSHFRASLGVCEYRLGMFQSTPTESTKQAFVSHCCLSDYSPLTLLIWLGSDVPMHLNDAMKDVDYDMGQFLIEVQGISISTILSSYMESTCLGLIVNEGTVDTVKSHINEIVDLSKRVISSIEGSITELPSKYLRNQLPQDVSDIVKNTQDAQSCATQVRSVVNAQMKHWKQKPVASTYCYGALGGGGLDYRNFAFRSGGENVGARKYENLHDTFSVGIDWTNSFRFIPVSDILSQLILDFDFDIKKLHAKDHSGMTYLISQLNKALSKYNTSRRNVAYFYTENFGMDYDMLREYRLLFDGYVIVYSVYP